MRVVEPPAEGVWRVARGPDPLAFRPPLLSTELGEPRTGNRFDSPLGEYAVQYFATTLDGCYGETLARFRPDTQLAAILGDDLEDFMGVGEIPADWRTRRIAVRVEFPTSPALKGRFLDVEALETREHLRPELAELLTEYHHVDLDVSVVRGGDRRITRGISKWAYDRGFAGVRYLSRLNTKWECWAAFDRVATKELERKSILRQDPALVRVSKAYNLTVF